MRGGSLRAEREAAMRPGAGSATAASPPGATASTTTRFAIAVALGLFFIGVVNLGVRYAELVIGRYVTGGVPPIPAFSALLALLVLRAFLRRVFRLDLTREQLLIVYGMVTI